MNASTINNVVGNEESSRKVTGWSTFWRVAGLATLFIVAITAICLGMHYGALYIAGLGLGELATMTLTIIFSLLGSIITYVLTFKIMMAGHNCVAEYELSKKFGAL